MTKRTEAEMIAKYDAERDGSTYIKPSPQLQAVAEDHEATRRALEARAYVANLEASGNLPHGTYRTEPLSDAEKAQTMITFSTFSDDHAEILLSAFEWLATLPEEEQNRELDRWHAAMDFITSQPDSDTAPASEPFGTLADGTVMYGTFDTTKVNVRSGCVTVETPAIMLTADCNGFVSGENRRAGEEPTIDFDGASLADIRALRAFLNSDAVERMLAAAVAWENGDTAPLDWEQIKEMPIDEAVDTFGVEAMTAVIAAHRRATGRAA